MRQYLETVKEVLTKGKRKSNRTGVDTLSTFNINYEIDLAEGFPLLTTKKISWKNIVVENLWFLSGDKHIGLLKKHGCKFWDPWADDAGFVPSAYGNYWRHFPVHKKHSLFEGIPTPGFNDQISYVINEIKKNPMSRRLVVSAWDPGNAQTSKLPPCHCLFAFNVQVDEESVCSKHLEPDYTNCGICRLSLSLNLHLTQRSCDVALGVPYNIAGYAFILSVIGHLTGIRPGIFAHTLIDAHIYTAKKDGSMAEYDHVPGLEEQLTRQPGKLPTLEISDDIKSLDDIAELFKADTAQILSKFELKGYTAAPAIKFKVAI